MKHTSTDRAIQSGDLRAALLRSFYSDIVKPCKYAMRKFVRYCNYSNDYYPVSKVERRQKINLEYIRKKADAINNFIEDIVSEKIVVPNKSVIDVNDLLKRKKEK